MINDDANNMIVAALARRCAYEDGEVWTLEGACISRRAIPNRNGVTADAVSYRYSIEHPEQGWSLEFRTVWRNEALMEPTAVHTKVEAYYDDAELGESAMCDVVNDWLRSLPL